jgi:hypothetical protein
MGISLFNLALYEQAGCQVKQRQLDHALGRVMNIATWKENATVKRGNVTISSSIELACALYKNIV